MSGLSPISSSTPAAQSTNVSTSQVPATQSASSAAENPYAQELQNLEVQDNEELMQVAFGSLQSANTNVIDVLSQAAELQAEGYQTGSIDTTA